MWTGLRCIYLKYRANVYYCNRQTKTSRDGPNNSVDIIICRISVGEVVLTGSI